MSEAQINGCSRSWAARSVILQTEVEADFEEDFFPASIQKNRRKIRQQKRRVLSGSLGDLDLRITENGKIVIDGALVQRHPGKGFGWNR